MKMDISVIIPLYNHERYIESTLDSVLTQTVWPQEIIVIDDGSTDYSLEKAQAYAVKYPKLIKVISQENRGAHATINRGILMVKSELIAILNSDDNYIKGRFAECLNLFEHDPDLSAVATGIEFIDDDGKIIEYVPWYEDAVKFHYDNNEDFFLSLVNDNFFMATSNFIFKKEIIEDIGLFADLRYAHDYDFFLKCIATGNKIIFHDRPLMQYRIHSNNTIKEDLGKVMVETACVVAKFINYLQTCAYMDRDLFVFLDKILSNNNIKLSVEEMICYAADKKMKLSDFYQAIYQNKELCKSVNGSSELQGSYDRKWCLRKL